MEPDESPSEMLQRTLHIPEALSEKLALGQLTTVEEVAYVPFAELVDVSGLPADEAAALRHAAKKYLLDRLSGSGFA